MKSKIVIGIRVFVVVLVLGWVGTVCPTAQTAPAFSTNNLPTNAVVVEAQSNAVPAQTTTTNSVATTPRQGLSSQQVALGLDRVGFLQTELFGNPLWKYVASLIYIVAALYFSTLLNYIFFVWLKRWTVKSANRFNELLAGLIRGPIKVVCFVVLLHIGMDLFSWPPWISRYLSQGLKLVVAGSLTYVALRSFDLLMAYWRQRTVADANKTFNDQFYGMIRKSVKAFIFVVAVLFTSQNLGLDITSVLASLSIGGLAVGLAAQDTLANLFGAVSVFLDKPFKVGDRIKLEGVDGVVEDIGLRSTRIRNLDGHLITVPNKTMGNATITNITMRPSLKTEINISLTYDTPAEQVKVALQILREIYGQHPMTKDVVISFNKFADCSLNLLVLHWWKNTDYFAYLRGMEELNLMIKQRFDAEKLNFAFPTQTLYVKQDSEWRMMDGHPPTLRSDLGLREVTPIKLS